MLNVNVEGIEGAFTQKKTDVFDGEQVVVSFANGYQASVAENFLTYGGTSLAVMHGGNIVYDTDVAHDVIYGLDSEELRELLVRIAALPERRNIKVDYWSAYKVANEIISEFGSDYRIPSGGCVYVTRDYDEEENACSPRRPSCLVGQILWRMGVSGESMDGLSILATERESFADHGVTFTDRAFLYLDIMQAIQDNGESWGMAHAIAAKVTGRRKWAEGSEEFVRI